MVTIECANWKDRLHNKILTLFQHFSRQVTPTLHKPNVRELIVTIQFLIVHKL